MAVETNVQETGIGVSFPNAYARIVDFRGDKTSIHYHVAVYATAEAREKSSSPIETHMFACQSPQGSIELFPYLYTNLKQQERFIGSEDC
tara:strand:- start:4276 stop:4545 length:270 start_codon:yes stop_codon:yes gene_type:complete